MCSRPPPSLAPERKMKKFNIRKVLDGLTAVSSPSPSSQLGAKENELIPETLQSEHFQLCKTVRHGFPYQPSSMAFDPVQKILAIGTQSGALRLYPFYNGNEIKIAAVGGRGESLVSGQRANALRSRKRSASHSSLQTAESDMTECRPIRQDAGQKEGLSWSRLTPSCKGTLVAMQFRKCGAVYGMQLPGETDSHSLTRLPVPENPPLTPNPFLFPFTPPSLCATQAPSAKLIPCQTHTHKHTHTHTFGLIGYFVSGSQQVCKCHQLDCDPCNPISSRGIRCT
ncbi:unnamed protein product [Leuciscus chuanchicus]